MKLDLDLLENQGWKLNTDLPLESCNKCSIPLRTNFYFCKQHQIGFCRVCELRATSRLCGDWQEEHEHYNIIIFNEGEDK